LIFLGLALSLSLADAGVYCTKEQHEHDYAFIENAFNTGMLVKGPKSIRDSILVQEEVPNELSFRMRHGRWC
jgi:hypothetical protein